MNIINNNGPSDFNINEIEHSIIITYGQLNTITGAIILTEININENTIATINNI